MRSFLQRLRDDNPSSEEDLFNSQPYDDFKDELKLLLSSRPIYIGLDDIPLVNDSVLNYGISGPIYSATAGEHSNAVNTEISSRISLMLGRYEQRLKDPIIEHIFTDDNYSVFSVTAMLFMQSITFCIKWNKHSGEFSLYE